MIEDEQEILVDDLEWNDSDSGKSESLREISDVKEEKTKHFVNKCEV